MEFILWNHYTLILKPSKISAKTQANYKPVCFMNIDMNHLTKYLQIEFDSV